MPASPWSVAAFSKIAEFASVIAASSALPLATAARSASSAVALAISPAL